MSNRFPCACPRAKQIVGQKGWLGFAGGFAFPGFKANWLYTVYDEDGAYEPSSGEWTYSVTSGSFTYACTGSAPNFAAGDLVLREFPAAAGITDYLTGLTWNYPKYYYVYICILAISGSAADPYYDTAHFRLWDYGNEGSFTDTPGPSGWPFSGGFALFAQTTDAAKLEMTTTTVLNNFPLFPATISGLMAAMGTSNDTANSFNDMTAQECSAAGTFVSDWTFANNYDGTNPTFTAPGTAPSAEQAHLIFPALPAQRQVGWAPAWSGSTVESLFAISGTAPTALVTWSFSASSLTFEFAAWSWNADVEYEFDPYHWGPLASAPATVTQTIALGGASYTLADVAAQAAALMGATAFASIAWGTSWTNSYNASGAVVSTQNVASSAATAITESGAVGTPVKWGVAINGCPFVAGETGYFMTQALVDICGNYCARTYAQGTSGPTSCTNGNVNGYAPFTLSPPATPGQSVAAYNQGRC
jgi:hypothetical protein